MTTAITTHKRKRPSDSPTPSPPSKRPHFFFPPSTPARGVHRPIFPSLVPDSPTNPFGRTRVTSVALPAPTRFGKHLPLRFQLVRRDAESDSAEGVYRIVQVPLSYTFRLLHMVLFFVFDGAAAAPELGRCEGSGSKSKSKSRGGAKKTKMKGWKGVSRRRGAGGSRAKKADEDEGKETGHLFEAVSEIKMQRTTYRAGQIKSCKTWAKLSSVRNPYRYRDVLPEDDGAVFDDTLPEVEMHGEEDGAEWRWEEEDMTLAGVWPRGLDLTRGIIYRHDSRTQVHITVNTLPVQGRKGHGNEPFVFQARGDASLGGPSLGDVKTAGTNISTKAWNEPMAFECFLTRLRGPTDVRVDVSTPTENIGDISQSTLSLPTPGLSASKTSPAWSASEATPYSDVVHTPFTPGPKHPLHRLRLDRTQKRIARLAKKGRETLIEFQSDTEDEEDELADDTDLYPPPEKQSETGEVENSAEAGAKEDEEVKSNNSWWQGPRTWEWDDSSVDELADDPDLQPNPRPSSDGGDEKTDAEAKVAEWLVKARKESFRQAPRT